ncbi:hypothetical protein CPC08DRAFT_711601 [Agrocybe pediades]|nr:hypothetical protein CPC08DRAFT_711601 [Agrocybe pediades]
MHDLKIIKQAAQSRNGQPPSKKICAGIETIKPSTYEGREPGPRPDLPVEIMDNILSFLPRSAYKPLFYTNSFMSTLARRRFYRNIALKGCKVVVAFIKCILSSPEIPSYIRLLSINVCVDHPTSNFYRLVQSLLLKTENMLSLFLEFPKSDSPVWMLDGCTFKLKQFTTTMHSLRPLAQFLETQESLVDLTLRGYQTDAGFYIPVLDAAPQVSPPEETVFALSPGTLPNLKTFNAIHADGALVRAVVQGRPIEVVSVPLFADSRYDSLNAIGTSSKPLKRLSLISFDPSAPYFLFEAVADRFAELEALHVVMLMAECGNELLEQFCPVLAKFKCLKYITFMAPPSSPPLPPVAPPAALAAIAAGQPGALLNANTGAPLPSTTTNNGPVGTGSPTLNGPAASNSSSGSSTSANSGPRLRNYDEEGEIAKMWHKACPTLRTIILPKGKVWFKAHTVLNAVQPAQVAGQAAPAPPAPVPAGLTPAPATSSTDAPAAETVPAAAGASEDVLIPVSASSSTDAPAAAGTAEDADSSSDDMEWAHL